jgi:hypothetical protein
MVSGAMQMAGLPSLNFSVGNFGHAMARLGMIFVAHAERFRGARSWWWNSFGTILMSDHDDDLNKRKQFRNFKEQVSMREFREALRSRYKLPIASDRMFEDLLRKLDEATSHTDQKRGFRRPWPGVRKYPPMARH